MLSRHGQCLAHLASSCRRYASTATADMDPRKYRNMALVAHIDSGKTTLTESILHASSYLTQPGSVDTGSTTTDFLPAERQRGITIQSASIPVKWKEWCFNLIDTPGHADFGMEVESASRVVDGAVVLIDSVQGVEPQTKGVWRQLDRYGVKGRIIFLNKLDRAGASFKSSFDSLLSNHLHPRPVPIAIPVASFDPKDYQLAEPGVAGLVDLVKWEIWRCDGDQATCQPLPQTADAFSASGILPPQHPLMDHLISARVSLLDTLSMESEALMDDLLKLPSSDAWASVPAKQIMPHLRSLTIQGSILPVMCGSAMKHIGTKLLMDYIGELFPSPFDISAPSQATSSPVQLLVWKVTWDKRKGWVTFVRVYSGNLASRANLVNRTRNEKEKVSKLLLLYANREVEVDSLPFGSVGVVLGLKHTRTGDTLYGAGKELKESAGLLLPILPPPSVISASVIPSSHSEEDVVQEALASLSRTDPSVRSEVVDGQILVHALGALHLEIVEGRLRDEWEAKFELGPRRVTYRETLSNQRPLEISGTWQADIQGAKVPINMSFSLRPLAKEKGELGLAEWDGNAVVKRNGSPLPPPLTGALLRGASPEEASLAQGISNALATSPNTSLAYHGIRVSLLTWNCPSTTLPTYLAGAASHILRTGFLRAGLGSLLEPYIRLKVNVDERHLGPVIRNITDHGGEILEYDDAGGVETVLPFDSDGLYNPPEWLTPCSGSSNALSSAVAKVKRVVLARAPLAQFLDYSQRLRALTAGHGLFESMNAGYSVVNAAREKEILMEMGKIRS